MILGLDISTSKIGYSIIDKDNNLVTCHFMKLKTLALEERAEIFYEFLCNLSKKYQIQDIFIEEPFSMFGGGRTTAATMSKLQRFNGMCSFAVRRVFGKSATLIPANKARKLVGLKIKRGDDTKKKVIEWCQKRYPRDFIIVLTNYGNPKPGTDDMADSIVIGLAGKELLNEDNSSTNKTNDKRGT